MTIGDVKICHIDIYLDKLVKTIQKYLMRTYKSFAKSAAIALNLALTGLYFGYTIAYFASLPFDQIVDLYHIQTRKSVAQGILVGAVPIGGMIGAILIMKLQTKFSPKTIIYIGCWYAIIIGVLMNIKAQSILFFCRISQGICVGFVGPIIPMMIVQLSPVQLVGTLGSFYQWLATIGACFSFMFQWLLSEGIGLDLQQYIDWMHIFPSLVALVQFLITVLFFPFQSLQYLFKKRMNEEAKLQLEQIYREEFIQNIYQQKMQYFTHAHVSQTRESSQINKEQEEEIQEQEPLLIDKSKVNRITRFIGIHLAILQNFSGINIIVGYAPVIVMEIFPSLSHIIPIILNVEPVIGSFLCGVLLAKFGRKTLIQIGMVVIVITQFAMGISFLCLEDKEGHNGLGIAIVLAMFIFMLAYSMCLGPLISFYSAQIVQSSFLPITKLVNCGSAIVMMVLFPVILDTIMPNNNPGLVFIFLGIWGSVSVLVNQKWLLETKGKSSKRIKQEYSIIKFLV